MADDSGEKTEQPSETKLRQARRKGQVAQSRDLASACVLIAAFGVATLQVAQIGAEFVARSERACRLAVSDDITINTLLGALQNGLAWAAGATFPLLLVAMLAGAAAMFLQSGPIFATDKLQPKLDNLNVVAGFKKKFFTTRTYVDLLKTLCKLGLIATLAIVVIRSHLVEILRLSLVRPLEAAAHTGAIVSGMLAWFLVAFLALGVLDLLYQRFQFLKDQRMSKEEVKREYKESEGDPEQKQRLIQARNERMNAAMYGNLIAGGADFAVVNPVHLACAIRFDPGKEAAPRLVAKGKGVVAARLREICREKGIPVRRNVELARSLYELKLWTQIPEELYEVVRETLLWVKDEAERRGEIAPWEERLKEHRERLGEPAADAEEPA